MKSPFQDARAELQKDLRSFSSNRNDGFRQIDQIDLPISASLREGLG